MQVSYEFLRFGQLGELVSLNLDSTHVTDAAIELLGKMGKLTDVNLYHSLVTGAGEAKLRGRGVRGAQRSST